MSNLLAFTLVFAFCLFGAATYAQPPRSPIDEYLETAKTIVVVKCLAIGPVNILLRAKVEVEILQVVKGKETLRKISVDSQFGMTPGNFYLLRSENEPKDGDHYFRIDSKHSAIPINSTSKVDELKELSPRIIILRTMNLRIYELENEIRTLTYELDELKKARKEN